MWLYGEELLEPFNKSNYCGIRGWSGSKSKWVKRRNNCCSIRLWRLVRTLLANIRLTLWRMLRRLLLHYSIEIRALSLLMTLSLIIATFIHVNLWVRFLLIVGRWLRRYYQNRCMRSEENSFPCLRLKTYFFSQQFTNH